VFYALFKSAAQFAILGRQKGLSRRRKGEGERPEHITGHI